LSLFDRKLIFFWNEKGNCWLLDLFPHWLDLDNHVFFWKNKKYFLIERVLENNKLFSSYYQNKLIFCFTIWIFTNTPYCCVYNISSDKRSFFIFSLYLYSSICAVTQKDSWMRKPICLFSFFLLSLYFSPFILIWRAILVYK